MRGQSHFTLVAGIVVFGVCSRCTALGPTAPLSKAGHEALIKMEVRFSPPVFSPTTFPSCNFDEARAVEKLIGPYTIHSTIYDRDYNAVTTGEMICATIIAAGEQVVVALTQELIGARRADKRVVAGAAVDRVIDGTTFDPVNGSPVLIKSSPPSP